MKLRLRVIDEYAEPLKQDQFYVALYRARDQRRETPLLRKAVLEAHVEKVLPWAGATHWVWEQIEITLEAT